MIPAITNIMTAIITLILIEKSILGSMENEIANGIAKSNANVL
jgi:hypothetical protein